MIRVQSDNDRESDIGRDESMEDSDEESTVRRTVMKMKKVKE